MLHEARDDDPGRVRVQRVFALVLAVLLALAMHLWVGDAHFNAADEGYLWYGVWRAAAGELPLRDFQSYDPGRYEACAALGELTGSGILGLRRSIAVFHALGLAFGLCAARRATRSVLWLVPIGVLLSLWLFPRYKVFEGVAALASTWVGVRLLEAPTRRRHVAAGACAGLVACFGRNFGLYAALGLLVLGGVSALRRRDARWKSKLLAFSGGLAAGYAPMLALFAFAPGFWDGFVESVRVLLRLGANLPSPWLWPWQVELAGASPSEAFVRCATALAYLLPVVVLPIGVACLLRARAEELGRRALFLAATAIGAFTLHHAAVRSDELHLAQSIQPTLLAGVALVAWIGERRRALAWIAGSGIGALLCVAAFAHNPSLEHLGRSELVTAELGGDALRLPSDQADYYARLQATLAEHLQPDDAVFFAPACPAFYPLFGRPSPTRWIYFFVPDADRATQERIASDLAKVDWVLIVDRAIARRDDLRFQRSHPLVWSYIESNFRRVATPALSKNHLLFQRRE